MRVSRLNVSSVRDTSQWSQKGQQTLKTRMLQRLAVFFLLQGFGGHDRYTAAIPAPGGYYCNAFCRPRQRYCSTYAHVYALMDLSHGMPTPSWSVQTTSQSGEGCRFTYEPPPYLTSGNKRLQTCYTESCSRHRLLKADDIFSGCEFFRGANYNALQMALFKHTAWSTT